MSFFSKFTTMGSDHQLSEWEKQQLDYKYLWATGLGLTIILTIIPNFMVLLAVIKDPHRTLQRTPSNLLIASQAMADLCVGLIQQPLCIWWMTTFNHDAVFIIEVVMSLFMVSSIIHVLALSYDRYVAVVTPLHYTSRITVKRTYVISALIWLYSIFYTTCRTLFKIYYYKFHIVAIVTGLNTVFPAFIAVLIYINLYYVIRKYKRNSRNLDSSGRATMQAYQRQRKMTVVLVVAFVLFLLCLMPWFVLYQLIDACPDCNSNKAVEMYLFSAFYYLFMFKSLLNPFIYAWRLSKFRAAIASMLPCYYRNRRVSSNSSSASFQNRASLRSQGKFSLRQSVQDVDGNPVFR